MYNLGIRRKFIQIPGNPVIEPGADGKQHVALAHRNIGRIFSVHTAVADIIRMAGGNGPFAHNSGYHRYSGLFHQL